VEKKKADIRHVFSDPAHGLKLRLSAASLTKPFEAPILRQEVDHNPVPMNAYEGSSEQSRCDIVATNSRQCALSTRDLRLLQLKMNLPLLQVELDQLQTDKCSQHSEELFVDKDTLRPRARAPSPWHSTLVPRHESNSRASGLRHDVFHRIGPLKLDCQAISAGSSALRSGNAPNPRKGVSRARPSNGDPSTRHCTGISRLALKPRRSVFRSLQRVSSLQAGSFRAHLSNESSRAPSHCEQPPNSRSSQPSQALQPPRIFEGPLQVVNMSEDDWEPDLESEEEPPSEKESRGQSDGASSNMGSDGFENEEDWQAGSEPHRHPGTHKLWLVEDHTTVDEVRQARSKTGASYPDPSRKDSDSKRHADQELTALRIQILEKRRSDSAQAHRDPEAARRLLERDEKELRDFEFSFGTFRKNIEYQDSGDLPTRM